VTNKLASFENDIDFPKLFRVGAVVSAVLLVLSVGGLLVRGLNLGIDFEGGTSWEILAPDLSVADARDALGGTGAEGAKIQTLGGDTIRVQAEPGDDRAQQEVTEALADAAGVEPTEVSVSTVGPTWGDEISDSAVRALVFFFVLVSAYISLRLEWKMAVGAFVSVVHDIVIILGVYAVFRIEVTPATVIAVLTIMGYSLYDTVVVFDKLRDNAGRPAVAQRMTYTELTSLSLNQVLMRSINTSLTSMLPVLAMLLVGSYLLGAVTLQEFGIALALGLFLGAYSSIFVATPIVAVLKEREPYYRNQRRRLGHQEARRSAATVGSAPRPSAPDPAGAPELSGRVIPPRPRKKGKRR
jgi:preprotein translocase subunit SecF